MSKGSDRQAVIASRSSGSRVLGWIALPLRLGLGGLFLFAAYNKIFTPNGAQRFSEAIHAFDLTAFGRPLPDHLLQLATFGVPWVEIVAGLALIFGLWTRAAALVFAAMLTVFLALYVSVISRQLNLDCGCFGKLSPFCPKKIGSCHVVQNGVLLTMALVVLVTRRHVLAADNLCRKPA